MAKFLSAPDQVYMFGIAVVYNRPAQGLLFLLTMLVATGCWQQGSPRGQKPDVDSELRQLDAKDPKVREEATRGLPSLISAAPENVRHRCILALAERCKNSDFEIKEAAASILAQLSEQARDALPALRSQARSLRPLKSSERLTWDLKIDYYVLLLTVIGCLEPDEKGTQAALADLLDAKDERITSAVLMRMWQTGQPARSLLPVIKDRVRKQASSSVRVLYLQMLSQFPGAGDPDLAVESLHHIDSQVRIQAAQAIKEWGEIPEQCVPELLAMLKRSELEPVAAAQALKLISPSREVTDGLIIALENPNGKVQIAVADCLGVHRAFPEHVVPRLSAVLKKSSDSWAKLTIISALGKYGKQAGQAVDALKEQLESKDETVRTCARATIDLILASQNAAAK